MFETNYSPAFTEDDVSPAAHAYAQGLMRGKFAASGAEWDESVARIILEAVAPQIAARAYDAGYAKGHHDAGHDDDDLPCDCAKNEQVTP